MKTQLAPRTDFVKKSLVNSHFNSLNSLLSNCKEFIKCFLGISNGEIIQFIKYWKLAWCCFYAFIITGINFSYAQVPDSLLYFSPLSDTTFVLPDSDPKDLPDHCLTYNYLNSISDNKGIPIDELGILPIDIYYLSVTDSYYVYGWDKIVILDGQTPHEITHSYDIPGYGSFSNQMPLAGFKPECFAYAPEYQKLFCATAGHQLFAINTVNNTIEPVFSLPEEIPYTGISLARIVLKYFPEEDKLYWAVNHNSGSDLFIFDLSSGMNTYTSKHYVGKISDIEFWPISHKYYVSVYKVDETVVYSEIFIYGSENNNFITSLSFTEANSYYALIKFVNSPEVFQRVVCTPTEIRVDENLDNSLLIIDPDDDTYSTVPMPAETVRDIEVKSPNKIYFSFEIKNPECSDYQGGVLEATLNSQSVTGWNYIYSQNYPENMCPFDMVLNNDQNVLFGCSEHEWFKINLANNQHESVSYTNNLLHKIAVNEDDQEYMVANYRGGSLEFFDQSGDYLETMIVGNISYHGFYCEADNKIFFYAKHQLMVKTKIFSYDITSQDIQVVYEGDMISGCQYAPGMQRIFISKENSNIIKIISPNPGNEIQLHTDNGQCKEIYYHNGFLYCLVYKDNEHTYLEKWNTNNLVYYGSKLLNDILPQIHYMDCPYAYFCYNDISEIKVIYLSLRDLEYGHGAIIGLTGAFGVTLNEYAYMPGKILFDPPENTIYYISNAQQSLYEYPLYGSFPTEILSYSIYDGIKIVDFDFSDNTHYLYISTDYPGNKYDEIQVYDCIDKTFLPPIVTGGFAMSVKYNPSSHFIYCLLPINKYADYSYEVLRFDEDNYIIDKISFNQKNYIRGMIIYTVSDFIIGKNNDIYSVSAFSNINIIEEDNGCLYAVYEDFIIDDPGGLPWNSDKYIDNYIEIYPGYTLTINSPATIYFKTNAKIIIHPGGKLIVNGATLTSACNGYWAGIELLGTGTGNQFPDKSGNYEQGYLELKNQATIENAICGVMTAQRIFPDEINYQDGIGGNTGGIINADDAIFRNNITAIEIYPYSNQHPNGSYFPNFCNFNGCSFIIDKDPPYQIGDNQHYISLKGVDGINFYECIFQIQNTVEEMGSIPDKMISIDECDYITITGCNFSNEASTSIFDADQRGKAVYAYSSIINVIGRCTAYSQDGCVAWDSTMVKGFTYGVYALSSSSLTPINIEAVCFDDNQYGVYLSGFYDGEITRNRFQAQNGLDSDDPMYGMFLENCEGYHIEANLFKGDLELTENVVGLAMLDSDEGDNEIYSNTFTDLDVGIEPQGTNRTEEGGLCLKCNDFFDNYSDIFIVAGNTDEGIAQDQGVNDDRLHDPTLPAGNRFSAWGHGLPHVYDIHNQYGGSIIYYYHQIFPLGYRIEPTANVGDVHTDYNYQSRYYEDKSIACPSKLGGGGGGHEGTKTLMTENEQKADSTQTELNALIDGGDTEELNMDVVTSIPDEALELRQQLIDESPYLTDTVMKSAIYKEDVLPNAMIRDVLVANPQSAKSDEVLDALDNRWDPMPDYMVQEIMAGEDSLGNKELMESRIRSYRHLRNLAYNELVGIYLRDTVNEWAHDSLVALLQNEPELYAKYNLAFQYYKESDTAQMNSVLNGIPSTFILSDAQQQTYQNYLDYIGILQALQNDTVNGHYPDSLQLITLYALADSCIDMPSVYARNLLIHIGLLTSNEMVYMPVTLNSAANDRLPLTELNSSKFSYISLFPNPAGNYFIVEYHIDKAYETAILILQDMNGKLINAIPLKGQLNQSIVLTGELNNGVYIVSLFVDTQLMDSQKITVLQ